MYYLSHFTDIYVLCIDYEKYSTDYRTSLNHFVYTI